jgi:hypothetical protein
MLFEVLISTKPYFDCGVAYAAVVDGSDILSTICNPARNTGELDS